MQYLQVRIDVISNNPDDDGLGDINFNCKNKACPSNCEESKFQFLDGKKGFINDNTITLTCVDPIAGNILAFHYFF